MYTIGDFLIQLKNAYRARKKQIEYLHSNMILSVAKILEQEGYIKKLKTQNAKVKTGRGTIIITLLYKDKAPAISEIKLISRPSIHHYVSKSEIKRKVPSHATGIISTSFGIMTAKDAQKKGIGGELICQIY